MSGEPPSKRESKSSSKRESKRESERASEGSPEAAQRAALAAYPGPGLADASVKALAGGLLHQSFAVDSGSGEYILQRVSPVFASEIHDNIAAVTRHLQARGVASLRLVETRELALFADLGGEGRWRLFERLPGVTFDTCRSVEQAKSAGALIAGFHAALTDFEGELAYMGFPYHDTALHLEELRQALREHADHPRWSEVRGMADTIFEIAEGWRDFSRLPRRVIHGDLKFSNLLFDEADPDRAIHLIDLDTLARLPIYFDLGDAWRSWCNVAGEDESEASLDLAVFEASAEGYLGVPEMGCSEEELASLAVALERLAVELSSRFAADVLNERYFDWDPSRFADRSEHNWVRAQGQLSLYRQARETRGQREHFLFG